MRSLFILINLLAVTALLLSYLANIINPNFNFYFSFLGLFYPFLLFLNIFFIIYWIFKRPKLIFLSLFAILLGWNNMSKTIQFFNEPDSITENSITILNYNVRLFNRYDLNKKESVGDSIFDFIKNSNADIICLQEYDLYKNKIYNGNILKKFNYMPYHYIGKYKLKNAIFSKYKIIQSEKINFGKKTYASGFYNDIVIENDTIRFFTIHLESNRLYKNEYMILEEDKNIKKVKGIFRKLKRANQKRALQAVILEEYINNSPYPVIICGDFNDTPVSYTYSKIKGKLKDAFIEKGSGLGISYNQKFSFLRIDYILHDKTFKTLDFNTIQVPYSDHYPIVSKLQLP